MADTDPKRFGDNAWALWRSTIHEAIKETKGLVKEEAGKTRQDLEKIERKLDALQKELEEKIAKVRIDTAVNKTKSGFAGLLGGMLPATAALIYVAVKG